MKEIQELAFQGFELWSYGKRLQSMENLCKAYNLINGYDTSSLDDNEKEQLGQLLKGVERYFRMLLRGEGVPTDEMAEILAVFERELGREHEKTVTLCRRIAELSTDREDKKRWYIKALDYSNGGDLDSRDELRKLNGEVPTVIPPNRYGLPDGDAVVGNTIILVDGRRLQGFPIDQQPKQVVPDNMKLDTTGQYLVVGLKKGKKKRIETTPPNPDREAFLENAFFLWEHREEILGDSRMFLAQVPIQSGMAYTGTSGFGKPTLGVYLEYWRHCNMPMTLKKGIYPFAKEHETLLYHIAGSPLSGSNHCSFVCPDGSTMQHTVLPFKDYWVPFVHINTRYTEAKQRFQSYTVREVVEILKKRNNG